MGKLDPYRVITVRLRESDIARLDELADGRGRPAAVEQMIAVAELFTSNYIWEKREGKK